jgi:hypothetical protein
MAVLYRDAAGLAPEACYHVRSTSALPDRLLKAAEMAWQGVAVIEWGPPRYRTAFRACRDDAALYVRFDATDEAPWHTLTGRDDPLWEEEVVELFLDPEGQGISYAEVEISPGNVVCDLRVESPWPALVSDPSWHWEGLESHVVRSASATSRPDGWIATVRLPWTGLRSLSPATAGCLPPRPGDRWRFNVFRIKRPHGPVDPERDSVYAAWSVPDGPSFHVPTFFRDLIFDV